MKSAASVILEDIETISEICGPHDKNLKIIEELLGARILTRGNEIILESGDDQNRRMFAELISELSRYARDQRDIHPDLIMASWESMHSGPEYLESLRDHAIFIPQGSGKVYPRNLNQARFVDGLSRHQMSFGIGPAGTGKTYLAIAHALGELLSHRSRKLVLTRPVVEAGESLGFLPGDLTQKLNPYIKPLYDAMESLIPGELVNKLEENRVIEIAPLAYMRGRSLRDSYIILDEAQNTTREQMKMFLTRLGEGSKAVITGDVTQIDLPRNKGSGLIHALSVLKEVPGIHVSFFTSRDVVRSSLVQKIIRAYEEHEGSHGGERGRPETREGFDV